MPIRKSVFSVLGLLMLLCADVASGEQKCGIALHDKVTVLAVKDNGTLVLADRREVRLDSVLLPYPPMGLRGYTNWPAWKDAIQNLKKLLVGKTAILTFGQRKTDRYGRLLAQIYIVSDDKKVWVQEDMIARGLAWAFPFQRRAPCIAKLLTFERLAFKAKKGIWLHEIYQIYKARQTYRLLRLVNNFQIVEGRIYRVVNIKGRVYLNFGKNWREDFTIYVSRYSLKRFKDLNVDLSAYEKKCVRVRGWIELRNGPLIKITNPKQLELIDLC